MKGRIVKLNVGKSNYPEVIQKMPDINLQPSVGDEIVLKNDKSYIVTEVAWDFLIPSQPEIVIIVRNK